MKKQVLNYNINKSKKELSKAVSLILEAAGIINRMDKFYKPDCLDSMPDFLCHIADGLMDIEDDYARLLLDSWYGSSADDETD